MKIVHKVHKRKVQKQKKQKVHMKYEHEVKMLNCWRLYYSCSIFSKLSLRWLQWRI